MPQTDTAPADALRCEWPKDGTAPVLHPVASIKEPPPLCGTAAPSYEASDFGTNVRNTGESPVVFSCCQKHTADAIAAGWSVGPAGWVGDILGALETLAALPADTAANIPGMVTGAADREVATIAVCAQALDVLTGVLGPGAAAGVARYLHGRYRGATTRIRVPRGPSVTAEGGFCAPAYAVQA